jgi:hypothetical protein
VNLKINCTIYCNSRKISRNFQEFPGISRDFQGFPGISKDFQGFPGISRDFQDFPEFWSEKFQSDWEKLICKNLT